MPLNLPEPPNGARVAVDEGDNIQRLYWRDDTAGSGDKRWMSFDSEYGHEPESWASVLRAAKALYPVGTVPLAPLVQPVGPTHVAVRLRVEAVEQDVMVPRADYEQAKAAGELPDLFDLDLSDMDGECVVVGPDGAEVRW